MADFINALRLGAEDQIGFQESSARRAAGAALANQDYRGAAGTLAKSGMLGDAMQLQGYDAKQQAAQAEAQKAEVKDRIDWMLNATRGLKMVPPDQRQQFFDQRLIPTLQAMGLPPEVVQQMTAAPKDDQSLSAMEAALGGEMEKLQLFNTRDGIVGVQGGNSRMIYEATPDPLDEELKRARIEATRAQVGQREAAAAKARRGPAPRARSRSTAPAAAGAPWEKYR